MDAAIAVRLRTRTIEGNSKFGRLTGQKLLTGTPPHRQKGVPHHELDALLYRPACKMHRLTIFS
jgi:hypothetical protein